MGFPLAFFATQQEHLNRIYLSRSHASPRLLVKASASYLRLHVVARRFGESSRSVSDFARVEHQYSTFEGYCHLAESR